jgi:CDP-6-deoxy-D-xylo-4-hexulose-3-dehydrase
MRRIHVGDFKIGDEEKRAVMDVLESGRLSEWQKVREFEQRWASFIGTRYCIATSSGAGALISALTALKYKLGLKAGTKVITTPVTFIATSSAISTVGFEPVYVDIDIDTLAITPEAIEDHLKQVSDTGDYGLIVPVDLMGFPVRIDEINRIAEDHGLAVLEDASQAHGTRYKGHRCGSQALAATFSFYIAHNIQAGEMGACVTSDQEINKLVRKIKAQGRACDCPVCTRHTDDCPGLRKQQDADIEYDPRFSHDILGYNFKTMEFQAALASVQLEKAEEIIVKRQQNVRFLNDNLKKYEEILKLPMYSDDISYLAYPLLIKDKNMSRRELQRKLEEQGVETRPLFGCIPTQQPAYGHLKAEYTGKLPNAEYVGRYAFYIGCHQYLTEDDLKYIVTAFEKVLG